MDACWSWLSFWCFGLSAIILGVCEWFWDLQMVLGSASREGSPPVPPGQPVPLLQHVSLPLLCETCSSSDGAVT